MSFWAHSCAMRGEAMADHAYSNPLLSKVMAVIRSDRPLLPVDQPFFNRIEHVPAGRYAELWFRTAGCTWDKQGGCTMCNYGASQRPSTESAIASVRAGLAELPDPIEELMISPSGSLLDPVEVDPAVRREVYALAERRQVGRFLLETRSEYVTDETMAELRDSQPSGRALAIEIGLESSDPWKLRYCVNKGHGPEDFVRAVEVARRHGVEVYANVCLGTAFLSPLEALEDAHDSTLWALNHGASHVVLFPLHVKPYTLLDNLSQEGRYSTVSLWSLVEILHRLDPALLPRVEIAWYRSYYDTAAKIRTSPGTCPHCHARVVTMLDDYRAHQTRASVDELMTLACDCREIWRASLVRPEEPLASRVEREYQALAASQGLSEWLVKRQLELSDRGAGL